MGDIIRCYIQKHEWNYVSNCMDRLVRTNKYWNEKLYDHDQSVGFRKLLPVVDILRTTYSTSTVTHHVIHSFVNELNDANNLYDHFVSGRYYREEMNNRKERNETRMDELNVPPEKRTSVSFLDNLKNWLGDPS